MMNSTLLLCSSGLRRAKRRRKLRLLPYLAALEIEPDRHGDKKRSNDAEECRRPLDAHTVEHLLGEEREGGAAETAEEGVCCDGRGGELGVESVYVMKRLNRLKGKNNSPSNKRQRDSLRLAKRYLEVQNR
jgi:hypothetical protein